MTDAIPSQDALAGYRLTLLRRDAVLATWRGERAGDPASILIAGAASEAAVRTATRWLDNELALRDRLDARWARVPAAAAWHGGAKVLVYPDDGARPWEAGPDGGEIGLFLVRAGAMAAALAGAHAAGILHRALAPACFLFDARDTCRLTGFGQAVVAGESQAAAPSVPPQYISPEHGSPAQDRRSDLYSLGTILFALATGHPPFRIGQEHGADRWLHAHLASEPAPAQALRPDLPPVLCRLLARLLAKAPDERYQDAGTLAADLAHCARAWAAGQAIPDFALGAGGQGATPRIPARLYGREPALDALAAACARALAEHSFGVTVLQGPSGSGKTALLAAFLADPRQHAAVVVRARADQYGGGAPYAALADGLRRMVGGILALGGAELAYWRARIAAGVRDRELALALVPELALLMDAAPAPPTAMFEGETRVADAVTGLLRVFSGGGRPLVLVVDNEQWLDPAAAQLLERVAGLALDLPVMLVLAARTRMAGPPGAGAGLAARLAGRAAFFHEIVLEGLPLPVLEEMLADTFGAHDALGRLALLVRHKTAGHPYFVRQFVGAIVDDGLVRRDADTWCFDLDRIGARAFTDNMVGLALQRLALLPASLQPVLGAIASLGRPAGAALLGQACATEPARLAGLLAPALAAEVLLADGDTWVFAHERLQEASYELLDAPARARLHHRLGSLLAQQAGADGRDDTLFQAADHLARASGQVEPGQAQAFAELAARAGRHARRSCAYGAAAAYLRQALGLLARGPRSPAAAGLVFDCEQELAHCLFLSGRLEESAKLVAQLLAQPAGRRVRARLHSLAVDLDVRRGRYRQASRTAVAALREAGIPLSSDPGKEDCDRGYAALRASLGADPQARLEALAPLEDEDVAASLQLLTSAMTAAALTAPRLLFMQMCETLQLTLRHGMTAESAAALAWFGVRVSEHYGAYGDGFAYGQTARRLVARHGYASHEAQVLLALDQLSVWTQPLEFSLGCTEEGFAVARAQGDFTTACFAACHRTCVLLTRGDSLDSVREAIEQALAFVVRTGFADVESLLRTQLHFVDLLRTPALPAGGTDGTIGAGRTGFKRDLPGAANAMSTLRFWRWVYLALARYLEGDMESVDACLAEADTLAWSAPAHIHLLEYRLLGVLALRRGGAGSASARRERALGHLAQLETWAGINPVTFGDKFALARGALHEFDGDDLAALDDYEAAARHARAHGFEHIAGIAHERAAALATRRRLGTAAGAHMQAACQAYRRWGALGTAARLEAAQGGVDGAFSSHAAFETAAIRDVDGVIRAARALSEEIHVAPLVQTLLTIALQTANAQRGLLIRCEGEAMLVQAGARLTAQGIEVEMGEVAAGPLDVPRSMLNTALRTRQPVGVRDGGRAHEDGGDPYLAAYPRCAALVVPLLKRAQLVGLLYLENRLSSYGFTGEHVQVLSLLAAQAAVSLETAQLYARLLEENRERNRAEKALRASRATLLLGERINRSGSWIWDVEGGMLDCSAECRRIFGLGPDAGPVALDTLVARIHPDDRGHVLRIIGDAAAARRAMRFEHRLAGEDGRVRHLSVVGQPAEGNDGAFVGTVSDITRRKQDEDALRAARAELAQNARLTTVGQLTAAIAHEVNQPLMAISSNAGAALRWLQRAPARDTQQAQQAERLAGLLREIGAQSQRAGKIIQTLQDLGQRSARPAAVDLHALLRDTLALSQPDLARHGVALDIALDGGPAWIDGDAVQLQQVLANLVDNALEAMAPVAGRRRELRIASRCAAGRIVVRIEDNGVGVEISRMKTMFEPFVSGKPEGMGMGLAVCRSIIEAHGGAIRAEPGRPHGCSIRFELPEGS